MDLSHYPASPAAGHPSHDLGLVPSYHHPQILRKIKEGHYNTEGYVLIANTLCFYSKNIAKIYYVLQIHVRKSKSELLYAFGACYTKW